MNSIDQDSNPDNVHISRQNFHTMFYLLETLLYNFPALFYMAIHISHIPKNLPHIHFDLQLYNTLHF